MPVILERSNRQIVYALGVQAQMPFTDTFVLGKLLALSKNMKDRFFGKNGIPYTCHHANIKAR